MPSMNANEGKKMHVKLKRYVSQNISSNSWNSMENKVGVLANFVLLYLFN